MGQILYIERAKDVLDVIQFRSHWLDVLYIHFWLRPFFKRQCFQMEIVEGYNVAHATISALESTRTNERFQLLQNNILKTALKLNTAEFM